MLTHEQELRCGLAALRLSVGQALGIAPVLAPAGVGPGWLMSEAFDQSPRPAGAPSHPRRGSEPYGPASSEQDQAVADRVVALVELARGGDAEAFGQLYDHYRTRVYRFAPFRMTKAQRESIHSYDEHLGVDAFVDGVRWYQRLIERIP